MKCSKLSNRARLFLNCDILINQEIFYLQMGGCAMATKSFQTDFKFDSKVGVKLLDAIEKSEKVEHRIDKKVKNVRDKDTINSIMKSVQ